MYPVLILRAEAVCLVILIFLFFTSRAYNIDRESTSFRRILTFAIIHVIFDIITVITVNNIDSVTPWINWLCHILFYLSAILFSDELAHYVFAICYPAKERRFYVGAHVIATAYLCSLPFLKISYAYARGTFSSTGPAAYIGYGIAFVSFVMALVIIFINMDKMTVSTKSALIPMMFVLMIAEVSQIIWRSLLFTGCAVTIVTVGFFFSLENPVEVFKRKAMTDALTGVRSRASYETDMDSFDDRFKLNPTEDYVFAFCDLNELRSVNNRFGHSEGDSYITHIASAISKCMKQASAVYRIGGDEFLVMYYKTDESEVLKEIEDLNEYCKGIETEHDYVLSASVGYARSSPSYRSLRDVVKTADYAMYQNKARMKNASEKIAEGTKLNLTGLTEKTFDVMCSSNDRNYPYITNLDTGVTRISPEWKEYFGLESEFYSDFNSVWEQRIHPDFIEGYNDDIAAVLNGHKKYHNYEYMARKADGDYVRVSCHGSIYRSNTENSSYFAGFMVNHGVGENTDAVTGLRNFETLTSTICALMDEGKPFSVLKLKLNNFARINMLYGYTGGNEIIKCIAGVLKSELGGKGEVFCQGSVNYSILINSCDKDTVEDYYSDITAILAKGVETSVGLVPINISGGALINDGEKRELADMRRSLVYVLEESHYSQRNKLVFYDNSEDSSPRADFSLLFEIHSDALSDMKYFRLYYQPIVDLESGKTVAAEALLRWIHPRYGSISPTQFVAFLENDPCFYRLGLGIIDQAVSDAKKIRKIIPGFRVNVNITALQLQNEAFADNICEILKQHDFEPSGLVLELTERCKEMDSAFLAQRIGELRSHGILVAFDDLGTGYSTINLLMDIPVDEIKLDRVFVSDLRGRANYQLFVRSLIQGRSSHRYKYDICFEGIENSEILDYVSTFGKTYGQGNYFLKASPYDEFIEYIMNS